MTDKRFKWLLAVVSLTVVVVAFIWKYPEIVKASNNRREESSEYVYIDGYQLIHADRKCSKLNYKGLESKRIRREQLSSYHFDWNSPTFCPKCVSDEAYSELVELQHNKYKNRFDETD